MISADSIWLNAPWLATANWAVFIDRDGVINEEKHLVWQKQDFVLLPGTCQALKKLNDRKIPAIVVHNAAAVYRGLTTPEKVKALHQFMLRQLKASNCFVDAILFCSHHPTAFAAEYVKNCSWHKPNPGMLLSAGKKLKLDLSRSWLVGDQDTDIEAGNRAGVKTIKSGNLSAAIESIL